MVNESDAPGAILGASELPETSEKPAGRENPLVVSVFSPTLLTVNVIVGIGLLSCVATMSPKSNGVVRPSATYSEPRVIRASAVEVFSCTNAVVALSDVPSLLWIHHSARQSP